MALDCNERSCCHRCCIHGEDQEKAGAGKIADTGQIKPRQRPINKLHGRFRGFLAHDNFLIYFKACFSRKLAVKVYLKCIITLFIEFCALLLGKSIHLCLKAVGRFDPARRRLDFSDIASRQHTARRAKAPYGAVCLLISLPKLVNSETSVFESITIFILFSPVS
jgi:hypothetical protein